MKKIIVYSEAVSQMCSAKMVFLEILQNSKETPVSEPLFNNVADLSLQLY